MGCGVCPPLGVQGCASENTGVGRDLWVGAGAACFRQLSGQATPSVRPWAVLGPVLSTLLMASPPFCDFSPFLSL